MPFNTERFNLKIEADAKDYIDNADNRFINQIREVAEQIHKHREERPVILLSGPSGSGKTTTALTLEKILDESGYVTHTLSLDNYFLPISEEEAKLLAEKKLDLESPTRLDSDFLNNQLDKMINCQSVDIPKYDFKHSQRVFSGWTLKRNPGELIILEGIHALNPEVITIPDEETTRIYVSVRTRIDDNHITLHPAKIRLLRRMIRDKIYRNRTIAETISMFDSVEQGEKKYIMPYKHRSDFDIDTFIPYELSAYKPFLLSELENLSDKTEVLDIIEILQAIDSVDEGIISKSSLIREFIGNGQFQY